MIDYVELKSENSDANTLLCIHTTPLDKNYFLHNLENIKLMMNIILIDLPNHGNSITFKDDEKYNMQDISAEIKNIQDNLNITNIYLLGHGFGGMVAIDYATRYHQKVSKLILVNSSPDSKYREELAWNIRQFYSKVTIQALDEYRGKTDDKSIRARFTQALSTYFHPRSFEEATKLMDLSEKIASKDYVHISNNILSNLDYRAKLRSFNGESLIIFSKNDVWPKSASQKLRNDLINAKYIELDTGHFPMIENAENFWREIFDFALD